MGEYSQVEENLNVRTHQLGAALGVVGFFLIIYKSFQDYQLKSVLSFLVFGVSIVTMFVASYRYHSAEDEKIRFNRKIFDHCAIYILIAGTYTPFALGLIGGELGWLIFGLSWSIAAIGIVLKLFFTGRFKVVSTLMYVLMGWMVMLFIKPLLEVISVEGLVWLVAGGVSYSVGAVFYLIKRIKLNHAIFHVFVLFGSICHFISVFLYI